MNLNSVIEISIASYYKSRPEVVAVYLFGSYAQGQEKVSSDIDLGILLDHKAFGQKDDLTTTYTVELGKQLRKDFHIIIMNAELIRQGCPGVKKNSEKKEPYLLKRKRFTLSEEEKSNIFTQLEELLKNEKRIQFAYLFGSFIEKLPFHDIDLSIWVNGLLSKNATNLSVELSVKFTRRMNYPVDIRILNFAPVPFRFEVVRGKRIYVRDEQAHCEFIEDTLRRYLDIQPILYRATKEAFAE